MPGFATFNEFVKKTNLSGQIDECSFMLTTANAGTGLVGAWQELISATPGNLLSNFSGNTAGTAIALNNNTVGGNIPINGNVSPASRFLIDLQLSVSGVSITALPGIFYLCDFLLCYPNISINTVASTLDNTVTLPRYITGEGVHAVVVTTTLLATSKPVLTLTFLASDNTYQSGSLTAAVNTSPVSQCFTSNAVVGRQGSPFLPWTGNISGIKSITNYTIATGTATGAAAILLVKPLMAFSLNGTSLSGTATSEKDLFMQFPTFTQIQDGACLGLLMSPGGALAASSLIRGRLRYGWN